MFGFELRPLPGTQLFAVGCEPDVDRDGVRKTTREGVPLSAVEVMVRATGRRSAVVRIKVPGDVDIPPFTQVQVAGLAEHSTVIDNRTVTWVTADAVSASTRPGPRESGDGK